MSELKKRIKNLKHYFLNLLLIWLAILFYQTNNYYSRFLRSETQTTILVLAIAYTILGLAFYLFRPSHKISASKGTILFRALKRSIKDSCNYIRLFNVKIRKPIPRLEKHENTALLFIIVKIFYLTLMLNFFFANYNSVKHQLPNLLSNGTLLSIPSFNNILFPFILASIFLFDTLWFAFGYTFEAGFLKNKVRSVEPTIFGWVVALASYPPFNGTITKYVNWYANDYIVFFNDTLTFTIRIIIVLSLLIYLSATFALGTKCSNLTNRGIVSRGPYRFVRHPAYISKNLAWWLTLIPILSWPAILSMGAWSFIYHLRSITEERHLIKDPDYQEYVKKVKYRYIPFVY